MRYSGFVTTSPSIIKGCTPKRCAQYTQINSIRPVRKRSPPNSPHNVCRVSPSANTPIIAITNPTASMEKAAQCIVTGSIKCSIKIINACPKDIVNNTAKNAVIPINTFYLFFFLSIQYKITNNAPNRSAAQAMLITTKYLLYRYSPSSGVRLRVQSRH